MNKKRLVERVAKRLRVAPSNQLAQEAVDTVLDAMIRVIAEEGRLTLPNFGTFEMQDVAAHVRYIPYAGEKQLIPEHTRVRWTAAPKFKELVNSAGPLPKTFLANRGEK